MRMCTRHFDADVYKAMERLARSRRKPSARVAVDVLEFRAAVGERYETEHAVRADSGHAAASFNGGLVCPPQLSGTPLARCLIWTSKDDGRSVGA